MSVLERNDALPLIPEEVTREIFQGITESSACLRLLRRLPNMSRKQLRLPILSALPSAYFVDGDTGLKQTTKAQWTNKYINAEEIAVIVPIPDAVADDVDYDIWAELRPLIVEAFGRLIDQTILYYDGTGTLSWPLGIVPSAIDAGNSVPLGANGDIYDDIMGVDGTLSKVEEDGFMVSGHIASLSMKARLRGLRATDGVLIFSQTMQEMMNYALDGEPLIFPMNGGVDPTKSLLVSGQMNQAVYSIRQEMTYKILEEATLTDGAGDVIINLAQQDARALRVVMRMGWQVPNPINNIEGDEDFRYPFSVLVPTPTVSATATIDSITPNETYATIATTVVDTEGDIKGNLRIDVEETSNPGVVVSTSPIPAKADSNILVGLTASTNYTAYVRADTVTNGDDYDLDSDTFTTTTP